MEEKPEKELEDFENLQISNNQKKQKNKKNKKQLTNVIKADENQTFVVEQKKGHKDQVIGIAVNDFQGDNNIIATSSDDQTIRLWDLRQQGSIKMLKDPEYKEDFANLVFTPQNTILGTSGKSIFGFDLKMDSIIINNSVLQSKSDNDLINCIAIDKKGKYISVVDDEGDAYIFDPYTLENKNKFSMQHMNIAYTTDFVYQDQNQDKPLCISAGFDCKVNLWDMEQNKLVRQHHMAELTQKYIPNGLVNPPLIYSVYGHEQQFLVSIECGHIICLSQKDLKKPKYIIDAHLGKVIKSVFSRFNDTLITSVSNDKTFAIFNSRKRNQFNIPEFVKKIEIPEKPNWLETTQNNQIIIADLTNNLSIYSIKN